MEFKLTCNNCKKIVEGTIPSLKYKCSPKCMCRDKDGRRAFYCSIECHDVKNKPITVIFNHPRFLAVIGLILLAYCVYLMKMDPKSAYWFNLCWAWGYLGMKLGKLNSK